MAALAGVALFLGCGDDAGNGTVGPHNHVLESVQVEPATSSLMEGETVQLEATPTCVAGEPLDVSVTWSSDDEAVATVDENGVATAVYEGAADVTAEASYEGTSVTGSAGLTVDRPGTMVETSGGNVSDESGIVTLEIPDGALAEATKITIEPAASDVTDERSAMADGSAFRFRPDGLQFQSAARLTIRYSEDGLPSDANEERLRLFHRTESGWQELTDSRVDAEANTVSGDIDGFSHFGVEESELPPVASVSIEGTVSEPVGIGATLQLTATLRDAEGSVLENRQVDWSSADTTIATVDETGLVTGVGRGLVEITASSEGVSASVEVRISGEPSEELGNNMSWPTVFADGIGLTGAPVSEDPGVRPSPESGIVVDTLPFFWEENLPTYGEYYEQQTFNTWRAEYVDGTGESPYDAEAYWGDNITVQTWSLSQPVRVEVALTATGVDSLVGFDMTYLYGQGPGEMQGTDGTTSLHQPLIYTVGPTLIVEKLDGEGGSVTETVVNTTMGSEVNVAGRIIYGHQLRFDELGAGAGWYRLRYILADGANVVLQSVGNTGDELTYQPVLVDGTETAIEIEVTQ